MPLTQKQKKKIMDFIIGGVLFYIAIAVFLFVVQRSFMYFPQSSQPDLTLFQASDMSVVSIKTEDGIDLGAWFKSPEAGLPVIVFFHGNASHMGQSAWKSALWRKAGFGALLPAYRGYAGNDGKPYEQGFYKDAKAIINWLIAEKGYTPDQIVIYGESLGTGVAIEMAARHFPDIAGLILEAPYTSFIDLARRTYFWLPLNMLMRDRYMSIEKISDVKAPLLILHGEHDLIVPYKMGQQIYAAANEPKTFETIERAGHNTTYNNGAEQVVLDWLEKNFKN